VNGGHHEMEGQSVGGQNHVLENMSYDSICLSYWSTMKRGSTSVTASAGNQLYTVAVGIHCDSNLK
jgi:hypothetical protein